MTDDRTTDALRRMVREVLREVLPDQRQALGAQAPAITPATPTGPDVRRVRVGDDRDLADLVTQVLNLAEDPGRAADVRAGRIRFTLEREARPDPATSGQGPIDVDRGAVTERMIRHAAREQRALRIGPRAVLTPLARDRARALGVTIERASAPPTQPDNAAGNRRETR